MARAAAAAVAAAVAAGGEVEGYGGVSLTLAGAEWKGDKMCDLLWWSCNVGLFSSSSCIHGTDLRLTQVQETIRARLEKLPRHIRRSIDEQRASLGMTPLWGLNKDQPGDHWGKSRRRWLNRIAQQRCRSRKAISVIRSTELELRERAKDGTPDS